jgi:maltodextrin utilization protein YvdJ
MTGKFFQAFYRSFFDKTFYQDVAAQGKGQGLLLLFSLFIFFAVCNCVGGYVSMHSYLTKDGQKIVAQLPGFTFDNGTLTLDRPGPVVIKDSQGKQTLVIFDPEHKYKSTKEADTLVLVSDKQIIYQDDGADKTEDLSTLNMFVKSYSGNAASVMKLLEEGMLWLCGAVFAFTLISFVFELVRLYLLALIIGLFSKTRSFTERVRLLVCASIPARLAMCVLALSGATIFGAEYVSAAIFIIYAVLAFKWTRPEPPATADAFPTVS